MTTSTRTQVAVIDRHTSAVMLWLSLVATLLLFTLAARDASSRGAHSSASVVIEMPSRAIAALDDEIVILPPREVMADTAPAQPRVAEAPASTGGLLGLDSRALYTALGAPDFVRRDGDTQMWRYGRGACTLTVFLHGQAEKLAVQYVEGRGLRSPSDPRADCADRVLGARLRADLPG